MFKRAESGFIAGADSIIERLPVPQANIRHFGFDEQGKVAPRFPRTHIAADGASPHQQADNAGVFFVPVAPMPKQRLAVEIMGHRIERTIIANINADNGAAPGEIGNVYREIVDHAAVGE